MWTLNNNTPFAAERCWVRDRDGAEVWLVAVKGTFAIKPNDALALAEEQPPVCLAPKFLGDPSASSLLYDSDLHHKKRRTDVILHGHAYAPQGKPATQLDVRLKVADLDKTVRLLGDRVWEESLFGVKLTDPKPFTKMPLTYERAFGGTDAIEEDLGQRGWEPRNPIGTGFAVRKEHLFGAPAPNLERADHLIHNWNDRPAPVGFGPIPGHWSPRVELAGTYDEKWQRERQPLLPEDFDERFFQCAPADQQTPQFLKGGELVELSNLTPDGLLQFRLPRATLGFTTRFDGGAREMHRADLHTVILEPDFPRVSVVWHTHLPCHHKALKLLTTTIEIKQRIMVSARDREAALWITES
ncbi:MAG: DUF2169 domain-containing protein [Pirellulaceae bacterium]|nr:DUF2169 domain-containing protein [Pirellulaceae bacterium]